MVIYMLQTTGRLLTNILVLKNHINHEDVVILLLTEFCRSSTSECGVFTPIYRIIGSYISHISIKSHLLSEQVLDSGNSFQFTLLKLRVSELLGSALGQARHITAICHFLLF